MTPEQEKIIIAWLAEADSNDALRRHIVAFVLALLGVGAAIWGMAR